MCVCVNVCVCVCALYMCYVCMYVYTHTHTHVDTHTHVSSEKPGPNTPVLVAGEGPGAPGGWRETTRNLYKRFPVTSPFVPENFTHGRSHTPPFCTTNNDYNNNNNNKNSCHVAWPQAAAMTRLSILHTSPVTEDIFQRLSPSSKILDFGTDAQQKETAEFQSQTAEAMTVPPQPIVVRCLSVHLSVSVCLSECLHRPASSSPRRL